MRAGLIEVHVWCVMTTHFHLLVRSPVGRLSDGMRMVQREYSRAFNRRHLDSCMATTVEMKQRHATNASLLIIDVDHFKDINDSCGHKFGDEVLVTLVRTVKNRIRKTDQLFL